MKVSKIDTLQSLSKKDLWNALLLFRNIYVFKLIKYITGGSLILNFIIDFPDWKLTSPKIDSKQRNDLIGRDGGWMKVEWDRNQFA